MKKIFIIANWKSNKTSADVKDWFDKISEYKVPTSTDSEKEIIICSPFTLLSGTSAFIKENHLNFKVGAQDFSSFDSGAHTGEEPPELIREFADYAIIGHSERRKDLSENDEILAQKVVSANKYGLTPIFCVQGSDTPIPPGVTIAAYEPIFAIGTGQPDTPEDAEMVAHKIKEKYGIPFVLYGGSVNGEDVKSFTDMPSVDGVLVGGASLDADKFMEIIKNS